MTDTKVMKCGHCNKEAVFYVRGQGTQYGFKLNDLIEYANYILTTWHILECSVCSKPTLEETHTTHELEIIGDQANLFPTLAKSIILYPSARTSLPLTNLHKAVGKEYMAALKYQDSDPNACAVYIGRALDKVCQHKKVKGNRLIDKLDNLIKEKNLPEQLGIMVHQIRQLRNLGAHANKDDEEVTEEDAPVMLDFLEAILEYLYVAPAKIAAVQARLKKTP